MNYKVLLAGLFSTLLFFACVPEETGGETDIRDQFVGEWSVSEKNLDKNIIRSYTVTISKDAGTEDYLLIANFHQFGSGVSAEGVVSTVSAQSINVPEQIIDNLKIRGGGTVLADDEIRFDYSIDNSLKVENIEATYTR